MHDTHVGTCMSNDRQFIIDSWDQKIEIKKNLNPYPIIFLKT
jgi:hypothetical protein